MHVVINARTDLFLRNDGDEADRVERAIARLTEAAAAGADVLYPVGRHDPETLRRLATELPLPINAIAVPESDDPASFGPLGVARISFGPFWQAALAGARQGDPGPLALTARNRLEQPVRPPERLADRIVATWVAGTARWVRDELAGVRNPGTPLADAVLADRATAFRVPVTAPAGLIHVVLVAPADH